MSQIKVKCPNVSCGKVLAVDASLAGKKGKCSTCGTVFQIPGPAGKHSLRSRILLWLRKTVREKAWGSEANKVPSFSMTIHDLMAKSIAV